MSAEARLHELGIVLPTPVAPVASYVPYVRTGSLVFVSGNIPFHEGKLIRTGLVGSDVTVEDAVADARMCAINLLAQLRAAAGTLDNIKQIVRVGVFVASAPGFRAQPQVGNGASDLFVEVFGDAGRHARAAVGVAELPLGAPVEVDVVAELR
jgi:enamine deaminase RidA (YjgF/YER057c/UK114 family)